MRREDLHPDTVAAIDAVDSYDGLHECGCDLSGSGPHNRLCDYHRGYDAAKKETTR